MAASKITKNFLFCIVVLVSTSLSPLHADNSSASLGDCKFSRIYNLGDSISDTGNLIREPSGALTPFARLPYGETYFKQPTGRCSDGMIMIDFIALGSNLSVVNPYKNEQADFGSGANFAVAGSTALSTLDLAKEGILSTVTNSSLEVQLDWMTQHFASLCQTQQDCKTVLNNSLFLVGEIGGNDINYALIQGKTIDQVKTLVPRVIQGIVSATKRVIGLGARRVVVPGNFPIGCFPIYLTAFGTTDPTAYDSQHCLKALNDLSVYQNGLLQQAIHQLNVDSPNTTIVYADYYSAFISLFTQAPSLGFDAASLQKACCGVGGDYNFNLEVLCGLPGTTVCSNPARFISWDGIHLTQEAYEFMATWLISNNLRPGFHCNA